MATDNNGPRINERIRAREVRLVGPDGTQIGIKPLPEALATAREMELDLVEVAAQANPPVCRIMDYGKWKYEAAQQAKESRRKSSHVQIKEMKYKPKISGGDFDTKTRKIERFLTQGHKVKVTIWFRGRELQHPELGKRILDRVAEHVGDIARIEVTPKLDGRNMVMVLAPDKRAKAAARSKGGDGRGADRRPPVEQADQAAQAPASSDAATPTAPAATGGDRSTNVTTNAATNATTNDQRSDRSPDGAAAASPSPTGAGAATPTQSPPSR